MEFLKAIRKNDIQKVEKILKKGYYNRINEQIHDNQEQVAIKTIPICLAVARGQYNIVKLLLNYGADIHAWNQDWASPIHLSTFRGYTDIVKLLLAHNVNINSKDQLGNTPLHIAAQNTLVDIVNVMLEHPGCDISIKNQRNKTALDIAREVYGDEANLICSAIVSKMRQNVQQATPPASVILEVSDAKSTTIKQKQNQRPYEDVAPSSLDQDNLKQERQEVESELQGALDSKLKEITEIEDEITTSEAERNKLRADIKKLEEKVNQQTLIIGRKEGLKAKLEQEVALLQRKLRPQSAKPVTGGGNIKERSYECPVCLEVPLPPRYVYQCTNGHIYCSNCKDQGNMHICPQCRVPLDKNNPIRNIAFSEIIGNLFPEATEGS